MSDIHSFILWMHKHIHTHKHTVFIIIAQTSAVVSNNFCAGNVFMQCVSALNILHNVCIIIYSVLVFVQYTLYTMYVCIYTVC